MVVKLSEKSVFALSSISVLFLVPAVSWPRPISVGDTVIEIPDPPGFAPVTPQMTVLFQFKKQFVSPTNEEFLSYIPESEVQKALDDKIPELGRRFSVQTAKLSIGISVSKSDFSQLKEGMKTQMDDLMEKAEKTASVLAADASKELTKEFGTDPALSLEQIVPLPPHEETDRTLAFSQIGKVGARDETGSPMSMTFACTATLVHTRAKVLFLYVYAEESGLEWTRKAAKQWADAIVAANPPDITSLVGESLPRVVKGINWGRVVGMAMVGGMVGLVGLMVQLVKHRLTGGTGDDKDAGDTVRRS